MTIEGDGVYARAYREGEKSMNEVTTIDLIRNLVKEIRSETTYPGRRDIADRIFLMLDKVERELPTDDERDYLAGSPPEYEYEE